MRRVLLGGKQCFCPPPKGSMLHPEQRTPDTPAAPVITVNKNRWWKASALQLCVCCVPGELAPPLPPHPPHFSSGPLSVNPSNQLSVLVCGQRPLARHLSPSQPGWLMLHDNTFYSPLWHLDGKEWRLPFTLEACRDTLRAQKRASESFVYTRRRPEHLVGSNLAAS